MRILKWVVSATFIASGLFFLNAAAANYWLGGGPPNPYATYHRTSADVFVVGALLLFGLAFLVSWLPPRWRDPSVRRRVSQIALLCYVVVLIIYGKGSLSWQAFMVGVILSVLGGVAVAAGPLAYRLLGLLGVILGVASSVEALLHS